MPLPTSDKKATGEKLARRRSAARLAAVQALYQIDITGAPPDAIIMDILEQRIVNLAPTEDAKDKQEVSVLLVEPDDHLLSEVVHAVVTRARDIDLLIDSTLSAEWNPERLETVVRCILRAGVGELLERPDVPVRVVISEYVDVTHAFYSGSEPGLVNAVLDRVSRHLRMHEFDRPESGREAS